MERFPVSYKDPTYDSVDSSTEQKLGIPAGLLSSIRLHGEKSNADQVSSAGARTPYQITPSTRKLILKKYGIDPYLSPELASEGAGLLLQESLKRNADDIESAVGEYHGGTDRKNWGAVNKAYRARVVPKADDAKVSKLAEDFSAWSVDNPATEAGGSVESDFGAWLAQQKPEEAPKLPPTMTESAAEMVTGAERTTPESEAATELGSGVDIRMLVEGSGLDDAGIMRLGADTLTATNPEEAAAIIEKQTGGVVSQNTDDKGNIFLKNNKTGQEVIINKPGLSGMDAFQGTFIGGLAALATMPAGRVAQATGGGLLATGLAGGALSAAGQAGIEAEQASQGGTFDKADVAVAGAIPVAVPFVAQAGKSAINAMAPKVMQGVNTVKAMGSRGAQVADELPAAAVDNVAQVAPRPELPQVTQYAKDVASEINPRAKDLAIAARKAEQDALKIKPDAAGRLAAKSDVPEPVPAAPVKATAEEVAAIHTPEPAITAKPEMAAEDFGALARKASEGSRKAQEELAAVIDVNPEAKAAADALGLDLPADLISDSKLLQQSAGLSRGIVGEQSSAWRDTVTQVGQKADEALAAMDGSTDVGTMSESVKNKLGKTISDLKSSENKIYTEIDKQVPAATKVTMPTTAKELKQMIDNSGGMKNADPALVKLYKRVTSKGVTYQGMKDLRQDIGEQLGNMMTKGTFSSAGERKLRIIYGSLASDTLEAVEKTVGGEAGAALRQDLKYANRLTATRKGLEKRIINSFGKEGEGSIAGKLTAAVKSGAKGDIAGLNKLINTVPKELHKETIATALMNAARTPQGNFSPNQFANLYQGIRKNAPVAKAVFGTLSKEENETLRSIYTIAKRTRDAENAISKTGKANQPLYDALIAQNAIGSLLDSAAGRMTQQAVSAIPSGGAARAVVGKVVEAVTTTPVERLAAVNKLLGSSEFADLLESASKTGSSEAPEKIARRFAASKVFSDFAKAVNMPRELTAREQYVITMLQGGKGGIQETDNKGKF